MARNRTVVFLLLAYAGAWAVCIPLWTGGRGLEWRWSRVVLLVMMTTPTLAALVTTRLLPDGRRLVGVLGLVLDGRRAWRSLLLAWFGPLVLSIAAVALAGALGLLRLDLRHFSGYVGVLSARGPLPMPVGVLLAVTGLQLLVAPGLNAVFAMGEEIGWRGFLRDSLHAWPRWRLVLLTGVVWGLWHAPIVLLGYNYPGIPPLAALGCMVVFTTLLSAVFEWLRGVSGSTWVSAVAHGSVNASAGLPALVVAAGASVHNTTTGLLGWTGWLVTAAAVAVLVLTHRWRPTAVDREHAAA